MNTPENPFTEPESFERALQELEQIVQRLEKGEVTLEEMMKLYERGKFLAEFCKQRLEEARKRIEVLQKAPAIETTGAPDNASSSS